MRKLLFVAVFLLLPSYAMAQNPNAPKSLVVPNGSLTTPKPSDSAYPNTKIDERLKNAEENTKPVIIPNAKKQELAIISLQLENAKLKAEAAIPAEMREAVRKADDAVVAFWKSIGVNPTEIATKWTVSDGQNGDIILTPKKIEEKPKTP
jgi:hypothetical protein